MRPDARRMTFGIRYISDTLMARNMTISDLFNDEK